MTCNHCHTWNFRDYRYCRHCGTKLDRNSAAGGAADEQEAEEVERLLEQAFAHLDQGNPDEALGAVQAALAIQPGSASAHSVLGGIYERQGQLPEAVQQYEFALQLNPESEADREKLAMLQPRSVAAVLPGPKFNASQVAVIAAVVAGVAVFATGVALLLNPDLRGGREEPQPLSRTAAAGTPTTLAPAFAPPTSSSTPAPQVRTPAPPPFSTASPPPSPPRVAAGQVIRSTPSYPAPLPPAAGPAAHRQTSTGLEPAAIGEVVPLAPAGTSQPLQTGPGAGALIGGPPGGVPPPASLTGPLALPAQGGAQPGSGAPQRNSPAGELSEQAPGFIRIEVLDTPSGSGSGAPARGTGSPSAPRKPAGPPSISLEIGGGK